MDAFKSLAAWLVAAAIIFGSELPRTAAGGGDGGAEPKTPPVSVRLAADRKALTPVVICAKPTDRVRRTAETLANYLGQISGAKFTVESGDGQTGIAVGLAGDFPALGLQTTWDTTDPTRREDYLLRSRASGVAVIGASELAVEYAAWDLLYRLGYRQFFPGPTWEVIPRAADLAIAVEVREHPSFLSRDVGFGLGSWPVRNKAYQEWCLRNRMAAAGNDQPLLSSGHAYDEILAVRKYEFAKHPEYLALVKGKRVPIAGETKFCISNPGLRRLIGDYAADYFSRRPEATSITLEPSDGLSWCECEECKQMGSVSDRVAALLNEAAAAIRAKHGDKKLISIYAYAEHAPPPRIAVDPMVVVNVATTLTLGNYTTDELIDGWHKQGAQIGIREYYGVYPWDRDLPGQPRMADLRLLKDSTVHFYEKGARYLVAESSDDWGVTGIGYYLTARMLWDVRETGRIDALTDDFFEKAFGAARKPIAEYYRLIDASGHPRLSSDLVGRMYRTLADARKQTDDPAVVARINDLIVYTRYVDLYRVYASAEGADRVREAEKLFRFTYRTRATGMIHSMGVWRGLPYYDQTVLKIPAGVGYDKPEETDPWKQGSTPPSPLEIDDILTAGIAQHHLNEFVPATYSRKLVPAAPLGLPEVPLGSAGLYFRNSLTFYTWVSGQTGKRPAEIPLSVKAGLIYQNVGDARVGLHREGEAAAVSKSAVPPDLKEHELRLQPRMAGLHRVEFADRSGGTLLTWPTGIPWTIPAGDADAAELQGRFTLYFYVPRGTKEVAGFADGPGELHDSNGKNIFTFGARADYFRVPVPPGQDGRLWKFAQCLGKRILLTVPPCLARDSRELLLPAEVVQVDATK